MKENMLIDFKLEYSGIDVDTAEMTTRIIDEATGVEVVFDEGYPLEPGKVYIHEIKSTGNIALGGNGNYYINGDYYEY